MKRRWVILLVVLLIGLAGCIGKTASQEQAEGGVDKPMLEGELRYNRLGGRDQVIEEGPAPNIPITVFKEATLSDLNTTVEGEDSYRYDGSVNGTRFNRTAQNTLTSDGNGMFATALPKTGPAIICIDWEPRCFEVPTETEQLLTFTQDGRQGWMAPRSSGARMWGRLMIQE